MREVSFCNFTSLPSSPCSKRTQGYRAIEWRTGLHGWEQKGPSGVESAGNFTGPRPFPLDHASKFTGKTLLLDANALRRLRLGCHWARGPRNVPLEKLKTKEECMISCRAPAPDTLVTTLVTPSLLDGPAKEKHFPFYYLICAVTLLNYTSFNSSLNLSFENNKSLHKVRFNSRRRLYSQKEVNFIAANKARWREHEALRELFLKRKGAFSENKKGLLCSLHNFGGTCPQYPLVPTSMALIIN